MQRINVHNISSMCNFCTQIRYLSITPHNHIIQKWRQERGLPLNPNKTRIIADTPDYSFLDGRITPYGSRQKKRVIRQQEVLQQVLTLTKEIDFAVERHKLLEIEEESRKQQILDGKLKPKGVKLLKQHKSS